MNPPRRPENPSDVCIDVIDDHTQIGSRCPCTQIGSGDFAIGHRWLPKLPRATSDAFFDVVQRLGGCASIFSGSNRPPHFGIFCGYENRKNRCIVQQRPSYLHVTLSRRQVTVPIAVILLAASIRCIVEVTRPRELAYLKERKVLRCYCAVDPDEKPRNN